MQVIVYWAFVTVISVFNTFIKDVYSSEVGSFKLFLHNLKFDSVES